MAARIVGIDRGPPPPLPDLGRLTSFRLRRLVNMHTKASANSYERCFELTLNEWRVMGLLASEPTLSMLRLAEQAQFDRSMTGRIVGSLIERKFVSRTTGERDARAAVLILTDAGRQMVDRVTPVASTRNEQLLSCLTRKEREILDLALDKLTHQALVMLDLERELAVGATGAPPARGTGAWDGRAGLHPLVTQFHGDKDRGPLGARLGRRVDQPDPCADRPGTLASQPLPAGGPSLQHDSVVPAALDDCPTVLFERPPVDPAGIKPK